MRRRSKEPRRISVVEGRAAASLAREARTLSCFILINETTEAPLVSRPLEHYYQILFLRIRGPSPSRRVDSPTRALFAAISADPAFPIPDVTSTFWMEKCP